MITFKDDDGTEMCLRPDLTVASCINYLKGKAESKIYYSGQAYRRSGSSKGKLINEQLGIEIFGSKNKLQDDINSVFTGEGYRLIKCSQSKLEILVYLKN